MARKYIANLSVVEGAAELTIPRYSKYYTQREVRMHDHQFEQMLDIRSRATYHQLGRCQSEEKCEWILEEEKYRSNSHPTE